MILFGESVTVLARVVTGVDGDGNDVFTDTPTVVPRCVFTPGSSVASRSFSNEQTQGQNMLTMTPTVYMPVGSVVDATSRVVIRGLTYDVDGQPSAWVSPFTGWAPGVEVHLKLVTG